MNDSIKFNLEEMKLQKSFKRLIKFARSNGFSQTWNNVFIIEDKLVIKILDEKKKHEIPKSALREFDEYERFFDENLLRQGYSWINLSLLGILKGDLLLTIEIPNYNNNLKFTHVNISHSNSQIINRDLSDKYKIVD